MDIDPGPKVRTWMGTPPRKCELTGVNIVDAFVDGKTRAGPWAIMSPAAHEQHGVGLGQGRGQKYEWKQEHDGGRGAWVKTAG